MSQILPISTQIHYRRSCRFIILLCITAFSPYVFPTMGLRLDHFVIYGGFLYVMIFNMNIKWDKSVFLLMALFLANVFWIIAVSLRNLSWAGPYPLCAALENFTQPVALIIVIYSAVTRLDRTARQNLLRVASITVITMLCINSFISILSMFYDTWPFLKYFALAGDIQEIENTTQLGATMGRYSGIFNQPAQAGVAYSIGLLVWVYMATTSKRISSIGWVSLILLIVGAFLSVSKVFIIGGLPLSMLYWFWTALGRKQFHIRKSTIFGGMIWVLVMVAGVSLLMEVWVGLDYFLRLFDPDQINDQGAIYLLTATRFGGDKPLIVSAFAEVWDKSPIIGFGVPLPGPAVLDNGYIEFFVYGGIVGVLFYVAILAVILWIAFRGLRTNPKLGMLLMALWILIIGAGIGATVLTLTRSAILLWVILVITFGILSKRKQLYPETPVNQPEKT